MKPVYFYGRTKPDSKYWPFSNFYPAPFTDSAGIVWPTTEHYFQAMKFDPEAFFFIGVEKTQVRAHIWFQTTPMKAAIEGRRRDLPMREDWEYIMPNGKWFGYATKDIKMYEAIHYKFTQHEDLKKLLLDTGDAEIIEDSPTDYYWGCGKDGSGKNMLGKLLMILREELKNK